MPPPPPPPPPPEEDRRASTPDVLSLFASRLSTRRFGDDDLRVLEAALSAGADVPALLATRSAARRLLQAHAKEAFAAAGPGTDDARSLAVADFFARAFALVGDVESCLAMRYEALLLRDAKYPSDHCLHVSREEWSTFAKDSLDNGFYTIASKAFANALAHIHSSHPGHLNSANSIEEGEEEKIKNITGLQKMAKSLSAQHSVQTLSAEYMKRRALGVHGKDNLQPQPRKPKLPGSSMFRLGIKTRNIKKLLHSRERNLSEI
ncbi:hypothetical protein BS78_05G004800 [Paspalum vaginatum]|nr:hypothetical protein BS78_05G004800 [Paspalum vaginatum]KAJ1273700.1 hypothetical protein BS78_05G004800 [Paspalum vaginatum]KAJ1273701.1 hypothetical protein BS78_05G004800 [Paspalum vaginatum]